MFRDIAADHDSPWSRSAPYLVARALIREATLGVKGAGADRDKLVAAEAQLQSILNDPAQSAVHSAARKLLDYVRMRLAPGPRMHDLAAALVRKDSQATIEQNSLDYRYLYDGSNEGTWRRQGSAHRRRPYRLDFRFSNGGCQCRCQPVARETNATLADGGSFEGHRGSGRRK